MKTKAIFVFVASAMLLVSLIAIPPFAYSTTENKSRVYASDDQCELIQRNSRYRMMAADTFRLPRNTTWEEMRPIIMKKYGLREDATWEDLRELRYRLGELDKEEQEGKRKEHARILGLADSASWTEIGDTLKKIHQGCSDLNWDEERF